MIAHSKLIQNYSVYNNTVARALILKALTQSYHTVGLLALLRYTPKEESGRLLIKYYIYGTNRVLLGFDGSQLWRKTVLLDPLNHSLCISFYLTNSLRLPLFSLILFKGLRKVMLASLKILISRNDSSWYTWNLDFSLCTVTHGLRGYIDFIIRHNGFELVYILNLIVDLNTIKFKFGNLLNTDQRILLKAFNITLNASFSLNNIIDFSVYKFTLNTIISVYNEPLLSGNLVVSGRYTDLASMLYAFNKDINYYVYAKTPALYISDTYLAIIWYLGLFNSRLYSNVFTYLLYPASACTWLLYDNDLAFDLNIPYRFSFLGYSKSYNLDYKVITLDNLIVQNLSGFADVKTVTSGNCITKLFLYTLLNKRLKVITPLLLMKELCDFIIIYTSCMSLSYYCDYNDQGSTAGIWNTTKNIYNQTVKTLTLRHNLNALVKINVRNVRLDLYYTYIIDLNTIQIVFPYAYKIVNDAFYVDLFAIWLKDN